MKATTDAQVATFNTTTFVGRATIEAGSQATARLNQIETELQNAEAALRRASMTSGGIGPAAAPNATEIQNASRIVHGADAKYDGLVGYLEPKVESALAADLRPLTNARTTSANALKQAWPIYARGRMLAGHPLLTVTPSSTLPPPPPKP